MNGNFSLWVRNDRASVSVMTKPLVSRLSIVYLPHTRPAAASALSIPTPSTSQVSLSGLTRSGWERTHCIRSMLKSGDRRTTIVWPLFCFLLPYLVIFIADLQSVRSVSQLLNKLICCSSISHENADLCVKDSVSTRRCCRPPTPSSRIAAPRTVTSPSWRSFWSGDCRLDHVASV